jgi:cell volume regulation protein A
MTPDQFGIVILLGAVVLLVAVIGVRLTGRLGVPGLLLYLGIGLLLGAFLPGDVSVDPNIAIVVGFGALVLILAHGGLTTSLDDFRPVMVPSLVLATIGVAVSLGIVALPLILFMGMDPSLAILLAAALSATDAAAVFAVLRRINVSTRLRTLLEGESGLNDAPVVVLVTVVASGALLGEPWLVPLVVAGQLIVGGVVGVGVGFGTRWILRRLALPAIGLYPIAAIAMLVLAFGLADLFQSSGFMAVYVAAVVLGSSPDLPHRRAVVGFSDGLSWLAEIGLFIMLGLLAQPQRLPGVLGIALVATVALLLVARPLSALISLAPFRWPGREIAFVSVAGLRGAVPIIFAAIPLGLGMPGAEVIFDATLIVVLVLTFVQSPLLPWLARVLRVTVPAEPTRLSVDVAPLDDLDAAVLGIDIDDQCRLIGVYVRELPLPAGAVASLLIRGDQAQPVDAQTRLRAGDRLIVVASAQVRSETEKRLREVSRRGRLGTWRQPPD